MLTQSTETRLLLALMKIRYKVITLLASLFAVLGVTQFLVQQQILLPSFAELERDAARKDMDRVAYTLGRELDLLGITARDWSNWADTYAFMQDHKLTYVTANLTNEALSSLRVNVLAFVGLDGRYVWSVGWDPKSHALLNIDILAGGELPPDHPWRSALQDGRKVSGLLRTNRGPLMAVFAPILNGFGQGPHRGMILLGRLVTDDEIMRIGEQARVTLAAVSGGVPGLRANSTHELLVEHNAATEVVRALDDIEGSPVLTLRIEVPRAISARGRQAVTYASIFLIGAGVIVLILIIALLNRAVLSPLTRMTRHARTIGRSDDLTSRLDLKRADELGELAGEFDRMVDSLASARRRLVDRSFDAGIAENASGVLHNLGNAMTPLGAKVATLQETLRAAPAADVDLVIRELELAAQDTERAADLETLLRLTSRDLAQSIALAQEDAEAVARLTLAIQQLLADLVPKSRSEWILEAVRLPDLIAEGAELVSPSLRARLTIELDPSVGAVGPVKVSRITLQQVFQNFIVNAAEAVQGVAGERGSLRIAADVADGSPGPQLHLTFSDNGVGISADLLSRIFERGFSTKPTATNSGIGLHWCANAINVLGGQLRAESPGPYGGAVLHLILPLERAADALITQAA
jgi:two-component system, NtrC family, sensor kinase